LQIISRILLAFKQAPIQNGLGEPEQPGTPLPPYPVVTTGSNHMLA